MSSLQDFDPYTVNDKYIQKSEIFTILPTHTCNCLASNHVQIAWKHACTYLLSHNNIGHKQLPLQLLIKCEICDPKHTHTTRLTTIQDIRKDNVYTCSRHNYIGSYSNNEQHHRCILSLVHRPSHVYLNAREEDLVDFVM